MIISTRDCAVDLHRLLLSVPNACDMRRNPKDTISI